VLLSYWLYRLSSVLPVVVYLLLACLLCAHPVTAGMGYEFACALLIFSLLAGNIFLHKSSWLVTFIAYASPAFVGFVYNVGIKHCHVSYGLFFYCIVCLPSSFFGLMIIRYLNQCYRLWRTIGLYYFILLSCIAESLLYLYRGPSVRLFHPLLGFYAGSLYDEVLSSCTQPLLANACLACLLGLGLYVLQRAKFSNFVVSKRLHMLASVLFLTALIMGLNADALGLRVSRTSLKKMLNATFVTPHLVVHMASSGALYTHLNKQEFFALKKIEWVAQEVIEALALTPEETPTVHVFLHPSRQVKESLTGAADTLFARPWIPEIHILESQIDVSVLKHELTHAFASAWNTGLFGVPMLSFIVPNMGLIEGLAVAVENDPHALMDETVMAALSYGHLPKFEQLFGLSFYLESPARAYLHAGSFIRYLWQRHGLTAVREFYRTGYIAPEQITHLLDEYLDFMRARPVDQNVVQYLHEQVFSQALHQQQCPRQNAEILAQLDALVQQQKWTQALQLLTQELTDAPSDTTLNQQRLAVLYAAALHESWAQSLFVQAAELALTQVTNASMWTYQIKEQLANVLMLLGNKKRAYEYFSQVQESTLSYTQKRRVQVKQSLNIKSFEQQQVLLDLIKDNADNIGSAMHLAYAHAVTPQSFVLAYLHARRLMFIDDYLGALLILHQLLPQLHESHVSILMACEVSRMGIELSQYIGDPFLTQLFLKNYAHTIDKIEQRMPVPAYLRACQSQYYQFKNGLKFTN